jgi:hypothetical protein
MKPSSNRLESTVTVSKSDVLLAAEHVLHSIESIRLVISEEEKYQAREGMRPSLGLLRQYATDGVALLARLRAIAPK